MKCLGSALAVCAMASAPLFAQALPVANPEVTAAIDYETARLSRVALAVRISEAITLDGQLDEPAWRQARPLADFITHLPREGDPATERTEVRILYDDDNLYFGFMCFDSEVERLVVNELREDFNFGQNDVATISIDSLHDRRSGFFVNVNPAGHGGMARSSTTGRST